MTSKWLSDHWFTVFVCAGFVFMLGFSVYSVINEIHFTQTCSTKGGVFLEDKRHRMVCMQGKVIQV